MPLRPGPPGYVWDERFGGGRYRIIDENGKLGKLVAAAAIEGMLITVHDRSSILFSELIAGVYDGEVPLAVAQQVMMMELKNLHLASAALGAGGWDRMNSSIYGRSGAVLRTEYRFLARFFAEIASGALTREQAMARAALYAENAFGRYWTELDNRMSAGGYTQERISPQPKACPSCLAAEAAGWVPVGTYTIPLHLLCRCRKEYRR